MYHVLFTEINVFVNFYNKESRKCVYHKIAHLFLTYVEQTLYLVIVVVHLVQLVFSIFSQYKIARSGSSKADLFSFSSLITNWYNTVRRGTKVRISITYKKACLTYNLQSHLGREHFYSDRSYRT